MKGSRLLAAIVACLLLPSLAAAQAEPTPAAAQAPASPVASPAGETKLKKPADPVLAAVARAFYATLLHRDAEALILLCRPPFFFEAQAANTPEELKERWTAVLQARSFDAARLYDVEIFTPEELTEKYGKPPEKLAAWPLKGALISVGNIDGHPLLVLWKKSGAAWAAVGFHD